MSNYKNYIQRFSEQFRQEIESDDNQEHTLQNIISLMNKCGLKELLDPPLIQQTKTTNTNTAQVSRPITRARIIKKTDLPGIEIVDKVTPNSTSSASRVKTGYNLFVSEMMKEGYTNMTYIGSEWKSLSVDDKIEYNERAKILLKSR